VADDFSLNLPSTALGPLLDLVTHARKHAIRLRATAEAVTPSESDRQTATLAERFEISGFTQQARSQEARPAGEETRRSRREARVHRYARSKAERDR